MTMNDNAVLVEGLTKLVDGATSLMGLHCTDGDPHRDGNAPIAYAFVPQNTDLVDLILCKPCQSDHLP